LSAALQSAIAEAQGILSELTASLATLRSDSSATATSVSTLSEAISGVPGDRAPRVQALASAMSAIPHAANKIYTLNSQLEKLAEKTIHISL